LAISKARLEQNITELFTVKLIDNIISGVFWLSVGQQHPHYVYVYSLDAIDGVINFILFRYKNL